MREATDSELLQSWRQGDVSAFRTLVRRHDKYLYRIARSIVLDDHDAEEIVQETLLRAFTGLRGFSWHCQFPNLANPNCPERGRATAARAARHGRS